MEMNLQEKTVKRKLNETLITPKTATSKGLNQFDALAYWTINDLNDEDSDIYAFFQRLNNNDKTMVIALMMTYAGVLSDMVRVAFLMDPEFLNYNELADIKKFLGKLENKDFSIIKKIIEQIRD